MHPEKAQNLFIALLAAGLLMLGTGTYLMSLQLSTVSMSLKRIEQGMMEKLAPTPTPTQSAVQPTTGGSAASKPTYVSCRKEYLSASTSWGDARLVCTDGSGNETVVLASIDTKFGFADANVASVRLVAQGQIVYISFRGEEDVAQYSLSYFNLRTGATGNLFAAGVINAGEYVPEASGHLSENGAFLVVGGGKRHVDPEYADIQTLYVFDLRSATLLTKISAAANRTFLASTDCFREIGDVKVYFTAERMTYLSYDKPISTTDDQGACIYTPKGGYSKDLALPR